MTLNSLQALPSPTHAERVAYVTAQYVTSQLQRLAQAIKRGAIRDTKAFEQAIGYDHTAQQIRQSAQYAELRASLEARHVR